MEGALDEITTMLQRMRTLAVQSSNGTNSEADRDAIQQEVTQLSAEITRIACQTKFGGEQVLAGAANGIISDEGKITLQAGAYAGDTLELSGLSAGFMVSTIGSQAGLTKTDHEDAFVKTDDQVRLSVSTQENSGVAITAIDAMIGAVDKHRAHLGAMQNRMESTIRNQSNISMNVSDARSRIRDTDFAEESAKLSQQSIIQQAASTMLTQANSRPQIALSLLG